MEEINDPLNEECLANNDIDFCSFYYNALKRLLNIDNKANVSYLFRYMRIFDKYYDLYCNVKSDVEEKDDPIIKLLKCTLYYRFIYVLRNATLYSSAIAFHFRDIYKQNPNIVKRFIMKKQVKICSFGGYSVSDIVAVITVLKSISLNIGIELDFRVTIIDSCTDWKNTCITLLSCLEEFEKATWKINFIQSNLADEGRWTPEMLTAIQEADVITFVRYISKLTHKMKIVEMICDESQTQAMLFILDHTVTSQVKIYFECAHLDNFHLIHVELCDCHTLDFEAVRHLRNLYQKHFGLDKHLRSNVVFNKFVSVWVRASPETDAKHKENMQSIFQNNAEKYNPKQDYLSTNDLTKWKNVLTKEKAAAGWNTKGIKKLVRKEEGKRSNMFGEFIRQEKRVHTLQKQLSTEVQSAENDNDDEVSETNEDSLERYLVQKRQYALIKKSAYFSSLRSNK
ncbi:uncharacterized protein LOC129985145 [Argiope bruennichi]|uniref:uncharacterized protein LOC129985145 n=1 Tax=Argiope bruennichi TaxID=94029 RepID=UPI0024944829|nr:uncharacterized protein LOC129985145 [Argiope bruennichi]